MSSRVVQHARGVLNCSPGACNFTCFGRVTPCTPRNLGAWLGRAWQKSTSFQMRSWGASPPNIFRCSCEPPSLHFQGAVSYCSVERPQTRCLTLWGVGTIFPSCAHKRERPRIKVLDAMMRGRHLCGMGTATATCCHQPGRTQWGSSTRAPMRTMNATHRAPATTRPTAVMERAPAASYAPPEREGRPMRHGWRRRPWTGRWSSRRRGHPRGHDREWFDDHLLWLWARWDGCDCGRWGSRWRSGEPTSRDAAKYICWRRVAQAKRVYRMQLFPPCFLAILWSFEPSGLQEYWVFWIAYQVNIKTWGLH